MDEERDGGECLAPRPLKPAERPSVCCHWLSWQVPPPSLCASQPAVGAAISLAPVEGIPVEDYLFGRPGDDARRDHRMLGCHGAGQLLS